MDPAYVEAVLRIVEAIPPGRVTSYGAIAEAVGRGGPRQVGAVLRWYGGAVAWWRVVRADGSLPASHREQALKRYEAEGTPVIAKTRELGVDMARARWVPQPVPERGRDLPAPGSR